MGITLVECEKLGIPGVLESWDSPDMTRIAKDAFLLNGVPECRQVYTPTDPSITDLSMYAQDFIDALTVPRTAEESASGIYKPPTPPRILMTGTYDEIQDYFMGDLSRFPADSSAAPISWMTDGGPIVPPTEERVAKMLTGTSHSPDEIIEEKMSPKEWIVTVEKVAINAVMAGCRPEYLPVVLAITAMSPPVNYPGDSSDGCLYVVSGPIAKEIGMNSFFCALAPVGNPANTTIARAAALIGINGGGVEVGLTCPNRTGNPIWSHTFAEATDRSPWPGLNVERGYGADESVLLGGRCKGFIVPLNTGEIASPDSLDEALVGTPEKAALSLRSARKTGGGFLMFTPSTAERWKEDFGFETIRELQEWLWYHTTWLKSDWETNYWICKDPLRYEKMQARERGTMQFNPDHLDLPDDGQVPVFLNGPEQITIIVSGGDGQGWGFGGWTFRDTSIDDWR